MVMPSWWEQGAANVIKTAKKYVKIKWEDESAPKPTPEGLRQLQGLLYQVKNGDQKHSPVFLLEEDCRKLLEWKDGGR